MLLIVCIIARGYGLPRQMIWGLCKENGLLPSRYSLSKWHIDTGKWQTSKIYLWRKRVNNTAKGRQGILLLHMSIPVCLAFKPHTCESDNSSLMPGFWTMCEQWSTLIKGVKNNQELTLSILSPGISPWSWACDPGCTAVTKIPTSLPPVNRIPTLPSFLKLTKRGSGLHTEMDEIKTWALLALQTQSKILHHK